MSNEYLPLWTDPEYIAGKQQIFLQVDQYLAGSRPKRILDIGCGYAHVSQQFQRKYGSDLWLLEGTRLSNTDQHTRKAKYGSVDNFQFYTDYANLESYWRSQEMLYTLVPADQCLELDPNLKFDLIYSWISCGYHYPVRTYRDLILKHSDARTKVIMDIRRKSLAAQSQDFDIIARLDGDGIQKKYRCHIQVK